MPNRFVDKLLGYVQLTEAEVGALTGVTDNPKAYGRWHDLIREGDRPGPVFVVLEGWAIRYKVLPNGSRQIMAFLMPGDACDLHVGLLAEMDHNLQTVTAAKIATVDGETMGRMMAKYPGIARALYIAQLADEGTLRAWIVSLGRRKGVESVAHLLLELYVRGIRAGITSSDSVKVPLSQTLLADALGMTPVHINRVLQDLRRSGAVEFRRGEMRIIDPAALTQMSGFDDNYLHRKMRNARGDARSRP